ncbi:MAG: DUF4118 domain-containing protein [Spirochaetaceae bacterium]|nr:MAG: DUF4118 domain-containing protein [Spirochaetaceae bacterium]
MPAVAMIGNMDRILACISSAPSSRNVVLRALEIGAQTGARVVAVHVQVPQRHRTTDATVDHNMALARAGGAETVVLRGRDVARTIAQYAELSRVERIVVGKNESLPSSRLPRRRDLAQRLIAESNQIDVLVVPADPAQYRLNRIARARAGGSYRALTGDLVITGLLVAAAVAASLALRNVGFADANIVMVFLLAVLVATFFVGRLSGIVSSVGGVLAFNFLFTEPRFTLVVYDTQYVLTFAVLLLVSLTISELLSRVRSEAAASRRRADLTVAVYRLTRALLNRSGEEAVVNEALEQLARAFGGSAVCYLGEPHEPGTMVRVRGDAGLFDERTALWVYQNGRTASVVASGAETGEALFAPLLGGSETIGVIATVCGHDFDDTPVSDRRTLVETFAGQVALALERERIAQRSEEVSVQVEAERLRNYLLRSISHDLRTPLAGIGGSAAVLADMGTLPDVEQVRELATDIYEQSTWLSNLVENLLSLTRIEGDAPAITTSEETVDDLVGSVIARMKRRLHRHDLRTTLPDSIVTVSVDAGLIQQVLMNLLENACRYSPDGSRIDLEVALRGDRVQFAVHDTGPGFVDEDLAHLFEKFYTGHRRDADASRGVGLGLAICRAIVAAHSGTIHAGNHPVGGALVTFELRGWAQGHAGE